MDTVQDNPSKIVRKFLTEADERYGTSGTYIDVRQVTGSDDDRRFELFKKVYNKVGIYGLGVKGVEAENVVNELRWLDLELALVDCTIENSDGSSLIEFENGRVKDSKQMRSALRSMQDYLLFLEIHALILKVNRQWEIPEWED